MKPPLKKRKKKRKGGEMKMNLDELMEEARAKLKRIEFEPKSEKDILKIALMCLIEADEGYLEDLIGEIFSN